MTEINQNVSERAGVELIQADVVRFCPCAPPVDEYAHQHQQAKDGESGDDSQGNDRPLLSLHALNEGNPGLVAAVAAL